MSTLSTRRRLSMPFAAQCRTAGVASVLCLASLATLPAYAADVHDAGANGAQTGTATTDPLDAIVAGPQRSQANKARDIYRHPADTLRFFNLRPNQTVVEISPGNGWYTEILAPYLHDDGKLYESQSDDKTAGALRARASYEQKLAQDPALYGKVTVGEMPMRTFTDIPAGSADLVVTFRNVHNWIEDGHLDDRLHAFYTVLKPGGVLGVEEHRAKPGTSVKQMIATGYMTEDYVISHARAAGFVLVARSQINANPHDTKDYPGGVWNLPPTLSQGDKDKAKFLAIGESDRMTLRFVKPAGTQ